MSEEYCGVKFRAIMRGQEIPTHPYLEELKAWCTRFHDLGLAPAYPGGSYGNLSFRTVSGISSFIITGTCMGLKGCLQDEQFVLVEDCDYVQGIVYARGGRLPSSESMMHHALYRERNDIQAVFHGHSPDILLHAAALGLAVTEHEFPYGSPELAAAMLGLARVHDFFIAKNHGFVALGRSLQDAGELSLSFLRQTGVVC